MRHVLHCGVLVALLLASRTVIAAPEANWPTPPKLIELPTPYGTLAVGPSDYVYEAKLNLDGVQVEPAVSGMLNISYAFSLPEAQAALVAISRGNEACPVSYRWVILRADGYQLSPEFGSCSEQIRVTANARQLTLHTPSRESPGQVDVYVYDGKTLKRRTSKNGK